MAKGFLLCTLDKTTCGGVIIAGDGTRHNLGRGFALESDRVSCGKHVGEFYIEGGIPGRLINGRRMAGTLHSKSGCPCQARFIPATNNASYEG